jgi:hypothetical protein
MVNTTSADAAVSLLVILSSNRASVLFDRS